MFNVVVVCGSEIGAQRAVLAGDDNTASASGRLFVDTVLDSYALLLGLAAQDFGILVLANTANEDD